MSRARKSTGSGTKALRSKNPAQFFADHQNIAGFDNPGKSLYTTIREFVENSLDAAESIRVPPHVEVEVEELSSADFRQLRGLKNLVMQDEALYRQAVKDRIKLKQQVDSSPAPQDRMDTADGGKSSSSTEAAAAAAASSAGTPKSPRKSSKKKGSRGSKGGGKETKFYRVTCTDNGVGMAHDDVPRMLGIVLSSTKYGVKQTRGKFGLGAKMALVWSKKSTGLPIEVETARRGKDITFCRLDLDMAANRPNVLKHELRANPDKWRGTRISVVISGNWTNYAGRIKKYMSQLAVITPYAEMSLRFVRGRRENYSAQFHSRTDDIPSPPREVKHHPAAVNNLVVQSLLDSTKKRTLLSFLAGEFQCIDRKLAQRLIGELPGMEGDDAVAELKPRQVHQLTELLRNAKVRPPSPDCLSPVGEYNLRLGVIKELAPDMVATAQSKPGVLEGHPFVVEAAVSIGGKEGKTGVSTYRFANRIPLLFEGGSDVASIVADKHIPWTKYKMNPSQQKIGVFVSIVSTQVPFKGTSKEYIADDNGPLRKLVKDVVQRCCRQLSSKLQKLQRARREDNRKQNMTKYVPDAARAVFSVLESMAQPDTGTVLLGKRARVADVQDQEIKARLQRLRAKVRPDLHNSADGLLDQVQQGKLTADSLEQGLLRQIADVDERLAMQHAVEAGRAAVERANLRLATIGRGAGFVRRRAALQHPAFTFRSLRSYPEAVALERASGGKEEEEEEDDDSDVEMVQ